MSSDGENWTELASGDDTFFEETNFTYYVGDASAEGVCYVKFNAAGTAVGFGVAVGSAVASFRRAHSST